MAEKTCLWETYLFLLGQGVYIYSYHEAKSRSGETRSIRWRWSVRVGDRVGPASEIMIMTPSWISIPRSRLCNRNNPLKKDRKMSQITLLPPPKYLNFTLFPLPIHSRKWSRPIRSRPLMSFLWRSYADCPQASQLFADILTSGTKRWS